MDHTKGSWVGCGGREGGAGEDLHGLLGSCLRGTASGPPRKAGVYLDCLIGDLEGETVGPNRSKKKKKNAGRKKRSEQKANPGSSFTI